MTNNEISRLSDEITSIDVRIMEMLNDISYIKRGIVVNRLVLVIFFLMNLAVLLFLE